MNDIPVLPAKAVEVIKNKRTGKVYKDKQDFDSDVANPETQTVSSDFSQHVEITVASLTTQSKTKD
tara:strand:+ start:471 stop:668 length:198 start_codon:yes stop_codon:yes gene_type:complete